jgi:hypothetical protein
MCFIIFSQIFRIAQAKRRQILYLLFTALKFTCTLDLFLQRLVNNERNTQVDLIATQITAITGRLGIHKQRRPERLEPQTVPGIILEDFRERY